MDYVMIDANNTSSKNIMIHDRYVIEIDDADSLGLLANRGNFEPQETALCRALIKAGDRVLDIGANIGYYTLLFCDLVSPGGMVIAVEPDPTNFSLLARNLSSQVANGSTQLHQVALGSTSGNAQLFLADESSGLHRLYSSVCCGTKSTEVSVILGDSLALAPLDFIKIDIEGFEPEALKGLSQTIAHSPNLKILCEFSPLSLLEAGCSPASFLKTMKEAGFNLVTFSENQWKESDCEELIFETKKLSGADFHNVIKEIRKETKLDNPSLNTIYCRSEAYLRECKYARPLLENLLFVTSTAWNAISENLVQISAVKTPTNTSVTDFGMQLPDKTISPFKGLTFPLNVYAHALLLQEGQAKYLHYGLFTEGNFDLNKAQEYSTELLLSQLPPPPCKILEVGSGLGSTLALLTNKGYDIHGITPDQTQVNHIQHRFGSSVSISCEPLENFSITSNPYDVIFFQESSQYIDLLTLFNKSFDLLAPSGSLIILDELALCRVEPGIEGLHLRADVLALADRLGFEVVYDLDLSSMAAPTVDYLLKVTSLHKQKLIDSLGIEPECLQKLDESNIAYKKKYAQGRYGYGLLHFRKKLSPKWRIRLIDPFHQTDFFELFKRAFKHDISPALWNWKYSDGRGTGIGMWDMEGKMVAHYGGTSRDILFFGSPAKAIQIGDVMVAPGEQHSLARKGPVILSSATFYEREIGYGKKHLLAVGFPNNRAYRVLVRLGVYIDSLGKIMCVNWPPIHSKRSLLYKTREINFESISDKVLVNRCWNDMSFNMKNQIIGVRDYDYLMYRYVNHPEKEYRIFSVIQRITKRPIGLVIVRKIEDGSIELMDIVCKIDNIPLLINRAQQIAFTMSGSRLFAWLCDNIIPTFKLNKDAEIQDLNVIMPGNKWTNGPATEMIKGNWWLTGGDTDFH